MYDRDAIRAQFDALTQKYGGVTEEQFREIVRRYKPSLLASPKESWTGEDWDVLLCEFFLAYVDDKQEDKL